MDIPSKEAIPFNIFYLIEFFRLALSKMKGKVADSHYQLIDNLSTYLLKEEAIVEGLEKVAKYTPTNDMAIFLFDMIERANDYGPQVVYKALPEQAEDFTNLYSLMIEDEESVKTIKQVIQDFKQKYGEIEKEKQFEEFLELTKTEDLKETMDDISFDEFYKTQLLQVIENTLVSTNDPETPELMEMANIFMSFAEGDEITRNEYSASVLKLAESILNILPDELTAATQLNDNLDVNAQKFLSNIRKYKKEAPEEFAKILKSGAIPEQIEEIKAAAEPLQQKKSSLDSLLVEYFKMEVEDSLNEIKLLINQTDDKRNSEENIEWIRKKFKLLKEVSMIHGYNGLEHIAHLLSLEIANIKESGRTISDTSVEVMEDIFTDLLQVENFADKAHSEVHVNRVKEKLTLLKESFSGKVIEEPVQEEVPVHEEIIKEEEVLPEDKDLISFSDRENYLDVVRSFFNDIFNRIKVNHRDLSSPENQSSVYEILDIITQNEKLFHYQIDTHFAGPLKQLYRELFSDAEKIQQQSLTDLENVWSKISRMPLDDVNFEEIHSEIGQIQVVSADTFSLNDEEAIQAFIETTEKSWEQNKELFKKVLANEHEPEKINLFLENLLLNLHLTGMNNYVPLVEFFKDHVNSSTAFNSELISEFENAFNLFVERLNHRKHDGDGNDILSALSEIVQQQVSPPAEEAIEAEQPDDDMALFTEETSGYLKVIKDGIDKFSETKDRKNLNEIENASHSVRSAAHMLNLQNISKLAATLEDAAEVFGQSELPMPENLDDSLRAGYEALENLIQNPQADVSNTVAMLGAVVDDIVIEDAGESQIDKEDQFGFESVSQIKKEAKKKAEEKPLFTEGAEEDQELLDIFKEESTGFLSNIQESNNQLLDNPSSKEASEAMGYAAHSLKSAAQMLGFREISQITSALELLTEFINNKNIVHTDDLHEKIEDAIDIINRLSENETVSSDEIANILHELEPEKWQRPAPEEEEEEDQLPENMAEIFVEEARELTAGLNQDYLELEKMPESDKILSNILRRMHTLKGSAYISKYKRIGDLAHKMEDYFQLYKQKEGSHKNDMLDPAFIALDLISDMVDSIEATKKENVEQYTTRLAEIDNKIFLFQDLSETTVDQDIEKESRPDTQTSGKITRKSDDENIIKINTEYMDKLVDMASELMINQTQLGANLHALKEILRDIEGEKKQMHGAENVIEDAIEFGVLSSEKNSEKASENAEEVKKISDNVKDVVRAVNMIHSDLNKLTEGFEQNISRISSISKLLHSDMLKTRMVPIENLFNRYPRAIRDMAQKQKKKVNLVIEDNNTEMDRAMVEGLAEPILHIIRNAVDHGLETPEERKSLNKAETGTLLLKAHQEKNQIIIDIEDDGRGIDIESVRTKIIEKELALPEQVAKMSEAEILDYIFYQGFSTKEEATLTSGRGIGLDAVATQIQKLKGNIRIKTEKNIGTSFSLRVPLTLIISQALMVKVNLQSVAIPLIAVQESIQFDKTEIITDDNKLYVRVRGRLLPYMHLKDILKFSSEEETHVEKDEQMAVVIFDAGVSMALGIDELVGRQEVVIKSLGSHLQNIDYIAGGTILASGDVALILDYTLVIRTIEMHFFGKVSERQIHKKTIRKAPAKISKDIQKETVKEEPKEIKVVSEETKTEPPDRKIKLRTISDRKPKIIIVDDSNSVRNFVGSILERNGFITIKSNNGADAIEKMKTEKVDLMITDLEMPKMHGFDLISTIRSQKKYDSLPIIILTGRAGMKHRQTGEELGANAFIVKPFKEKDLLQSLAEFISSGN